MKSWLQRLFRGRKPRPTCNRPHRVRPSLEALEYRLAPTIDLISQGQPPGTPANDHSNMALIGSDNTTYSRAASEDGRYVVFLSSASNLVPDQVDGTNQDVFLHDRQTGQTTLISHTGDGLTAANGFSFKPQISRDGRVVIFASTATNLVSGFTNNNGFGGDIYRWEAGEVTLVSHAVGSTTDGANADCNSAVISGDGKVVAFDTSATNLVADYTQGVNGKDVFRWFDGTVSLASGAAGSLTQGSDGSASDPVLNFDGSVVVYSSRATHLVSGFMDNNGSSEDVYRWENGTITLISGMNGSATVGGNGESSHPVVSDSGDQIVFEGGATNLVPGFSGGSGFNVFRWEDGFTTLISAVSGSATQAGNSGSDDPTISADGSTIVFESSATDLVPGYVSGSGKDIYRWTEAGGLQLISGAGGSPTQGSDGFPNDLSISRDGNTISFESSAANMIAGGTDTNSALDIFVWSYGTLYLASGAGGSVTQTGDNGASDAVVAPGGTLVLFGSGATDLVAGDTNNLSDVFAFEVPPTTIGSYTWNDAANTLILHLATNQSLTVSETAGVVTFTVDSSTLASSGGDAASGDGTATLTFNAADLVTSVMIDNSGVGAGTNNVTFSGAGSLSSATISVAITDADATGDISTTGGFDLAVTTGGIGLTGDLLNVGAQSTLSTNGSSITLAADSITLNAAGSVSGGTNTVTLKTKTTDGSIGIDIGSADSATALGLTDTELGRITAGKIVIGDATVAYTITLANAIQHAGDADIEVVTARNIETLTNSSWTTTNGDLSFSANRQQTPTGTGFPGINLDTTTITTNGTGNISLSGRAGTGSAATGVFVGSDSVVASTGMGATAGTITIDGIGGGGTSSNYGVAVWNGSKITSVDGDITVTGVAGNGSMGDNYGVTLFDPEGAGGGEISTTGSANIFINGTGGTSDLGGNPNVGVGIEAANSKVTSVNGTIEILGTATDGFSNAIRIAADTGTSGVMTTAGSVKLTADRITIDAGGSVNTGANPLTIKPKTAGTNIVLMGADGSTTLGLSPGDLFRISAGTLIVGNEDTAGTINVASSLDFSTTTELFLLTPEMVLLNGDVDLSGGNLTVQASEIRAKGGTVLSTGASQVLFTGPGGLEGPQQVVLQAVHNGTGVLPVNGNLLLPDNLVHKVDIDGLSPVGTYDVLDVSGIITLNNPMLNLDISFAPAEGASFMLIDNNSGVPINGTYAGLPEGKMFAVNDLVYQITYGAGMSSNDVVITRVPPPPSTLMVGSAADDVGDDAMTLREALELANLLPDPNTITFSDSLTANGDATITLSDFDSGLDNDEVGPSAFIIRTPITISGPSGENGVIIQRGARAREIRAFTVTGTGDLTLENLTIANFIAKGGNGGYGVGAGGGGGGAAGLGGGIFNLGSLTIRNSTLTGNTAQGGGGESSGGGTEHGAGGGGGLGTDGETATGVNGGAGGGPRGGAGAVLNGTAPGNGGYGGGGGGGAAGLNGSAVGGLGAFGGGGGGGSGGGNGGNGGFGGGGGGGGANFGSGSGTGGSTDFGGGDGGAGGPTTNSGGGGGGGGAAFGGAVFSFEGSVLIVNSTLSGNTVRGGDGEPGDNGGAGGGGGLASGAGLFSIGGSVTITNSTFFGNTVVPGKGAAGAREGEAGAGALDVFDDDGGAISLTLNNSILAGSVGAAKELEARSGVPISGVNNVIQGGVRFEAEEPPGFVVSDADPQLGPLQDNGGPTATHALTSASPAIDAGSGGAAAGIATDQRGRARISGAAVDIGAFEAPRPTSTSTAAPLRTYQTVTGRTLRARRRRGLLREFGKAAGKRVKVQLVSGPEVGRLRLRKDGSFVYTPPEGFTGQVTFVVRRFDGAGLDEQVTVVLTVAPRLRVFNVVSGQTLDVGPEDGLLRDVRGFVMGPVAVELVQGLRRGRLELKPDGAFTFVAPLDFRRGVSFRYRLVIGGVPGAVGRVLLTSQPHPLAERVGPPPA